jgi:hypothetical protein
MVIVVISNKKHSQASPKVNPTLTDNSFILNILPASPWFQRFYAPALIPHLGNSEKAKNLTKRYQIIF